MKVLVTGATGFVGSYLCKELSDHGHEAVPLSFDGGNDTIKCDITDGRSLQHLCLEYQPEAAVHLAGIAKTNLSDEIVCDLAHVNVCGTHNLCQALVAAKCRQLIYVSSGLVYGGASTKNGYDEHSPVKPPHVYAQSKVAAEEVVRLYGYNEKILKTYILRPFNHIGPRQSEDFVVPALARRIKDAADGDRISVGDLSAHRDFVDVRDIVWAYRSILERSPVEDLFVLGSGKPTKIADILDELIALSGKSLEVEVDPHLLRKNDPNMVFANAELAAKVVGWAPRRQLGDSLRDVYESLA